MNINPRHAKTIWGRKEIFMYLAAFLFGMMLIIGAAIAANTRTAHADLMSPNECVQLQAQEKEPYQSLMDCYNAYSHAMNDGYGMYVISELLSDECFAGGTVNDGSKMQVIDQFDQSKSSNNKNLFETEWNNYYNAIAYCNAFIANYEENKYGEGEEIQQYLGEVYGLRALCYSDLAKLFQNIPVVQKPTDKPTEQYTNPELLYTEIFTDYLKAISLAQTVKAKDNSRLTKYNIQALCARTWLFYYNYYGAFPKWKQWNEEQQRWEYFELAIGDIVNHLKQVINSGAYGLEPDYTSLWQQISADYWIVEQGGTPYSHNLEEITYNYRGNSGNEVMFAIAYDSHTCAQKPTWQNNLGVNGLSYIYKNQGRGQLSVSPLYYKNLVTTHPNDPRLKFCVGDVEKDINTYYPEKAEDLKKTIPTMREYTGLVDNKFIPLCYGDDGTKINYYQNYCVIRYAEVLLMTSEISGDPQYIAQVQARAGMPSTPTDPDHMMAEYEAEFALEGINYWYKLSKTKYGTDAFVNYIIANQDKAEVTSGGTKASMSFNPANIKPIKFLQIPDNIIKMYGFQQNPGWK